MVADALIAAYRRFIGVVIAGAVCLLGWIAIDALEVADETWSACVLMREPLQSVIAPGYIVDGQCYRPDPDWNGKRNKDDGWWIP